MFGIIMSKYFTVVSKKWTLAGCMCFGMWLIVSELFVWHDYGLYI